MLYTVLLVTEVLLSAALITLILMQHGKGADAGAAFGGGASGTVFGSQGAANFLSRTTAVLATAFFINCMALAYIVAHRTEATSIFDTVVEESGAPANTVNEIPVVGESEEAGSTEAKDTGAPDIPEADVPSAETSKVVEDIPAFGDAADSKSGKKEDIPE